MAIDWKTIISEFDGKPTLLQAIGKLRKAVEDETITIQQAQAEIAKLESQQKADEALIKTAQSTADEAKINAYNASQKGDQALGKATTADTKAQAADTKAQAADTKAQNALDLATTNETDIATLDGQVAELETNALKKQNVKTVLGALITGSGDIAPTVSFENGGQSQPFYRMFVNKNLYNTLVYQDTFSIGAPKLKTIFGNQSLVGTGNIDLYRHHIVLTSNGEKGFFDFYSSKNTKCVSLADLKTLLGDTFEVEVCGQYSFRDSGDNDRFYRYAYITETAIFVEKVHTTQSGDLDNNYPTIGTDSNVTWAGITITDTVTTI